MAEYYAQPVEYPSPPQQPDGRSEPRPDEMPGHAHEGTDVNIRPLLVTAGVMVVFLVATCVFIAYLFNLYAYVERRADTPATGIGAVKVELPEGTPKLQGIPGYSLTGAAETRIFKEHNGELLTTYSIEKNGLARIPVEKAMDVALEKKLFKAAAAPASSAPVKAATPDSGTHVTGETSTAGPSKSEDAPKTDSAPKKTEPEVKKPESELESK